MKFNNFRVYKSQGDGSFNIKAIKSIGENVIFEEGVLAFHPENIIIGDNVYIGHNTILKAYYKNELIIGENTWIGQSCFFHSAGGIKIGRAVGIGPMVKIITSCHKDEEKSSPVLFQELEFNAVNVEDGSDIGTGSVILPGVTIGEGAIIGAGSVVTRNIPMYCVAAGNPAKVIRIRKKKDVE